MPPQADYDIHTEFQVPRTKTSRIEGLGLAPEKRR